MRAAADLTVELAAAKLRITGLEETLRPFAEIALERDTDPAAPDMISGPDFAIQPSQIRAARRILDIDLSPPVTGVSCNA